jgi:hypothetical protein
MERKLKMMIKILSEALRLSYIKKAQEKIIEDNKKCFEFIKSKGLAISFEPISSHYESEHIYNVAKDMWEADGYRDTPTKFTRVSENELHFLNNVFKDNINVDATN